MTIQKIIKNKKGVSPTEMIISFVLFIGILTFLFSYMNPLQRQPVVADVDAVSDAIKQYSTINMEKRSLIINETPQNCFMVNDKFSGGKRLVLDENKKSVPFRKLNDKIKIEEGHNLYYVYNLTKNVEISESDLENCEELNSENYDYSVLMNEEMYSYDKLKKMEETPKSEMKKILNIANDFALVVFNESDVFIDNRGKIPQTSVITQEFPINMLYNNSEIKAVMRVYAY